jgi:hypothetical protein
LRGLSLEGTWRDKAGAEIRFTTGATDDPTDLYGGALGTGIFEFVDVPELFDYRTVDNPPANGHGYWTTDGQTAGGIVFTFQGGGWPVGSAPVVSLLVEGSPSEPILLCRYPDISDSCTFRKQ